MASSPPARIQFSLRFLFKAVATIAVVIGVLVGAGRLYLHWLYPYGRSHCCDTGLWLALQNYAASPGGAFPVGEATPEVSLSLLYPQHVDANMLRGKIVPLADIEAALKKNGRLDPTTCGWHYVEGLTTSDDGGIAIVWDKVGLGHNGERLPQGDHTVLFLNGRSEQIAVDRWQAFLEEQQKLLASRTRAAAPSKAGASNAGSSKAATQSEPAPRN